MTDARYPERWLLDRRITRLSDRAHRAFVVSLAYAVANRTDGELALADLEDMPRYVQDEAGALVEAGLWEPLSSGTGYFIAEFVGTQSSRAELEANDKARVKAREKKAGQRARAKGDPDPPSAVPGDVPGDNRDAGSPRSAVPGDSTGKASARTGQAQDTPGFEFQQQPDVAYDPWADHPVAVPGHSALALVREKGNGYEPDCPGCGWQFGHEPNCWLAS